MLGRDHYYAVKLHPIEDRYSQQLHHHANVEAKWPFSAITSISAIFDADAHRTIINQIKK